MVAYDGWCGSGCFVYGTEHGLVRQDVAFIGFPLFISFPIVIQIIVSAFYHYAVGDDVTVALGIVFLS